MSADSNTESVKEVQVTLDEIELAEIIQLVEVKHDELERDCHYSDSFENPCFLRSRRMKELLEKLKLSEAESEEKAPEPIPDQIICYFHRKELEKLADMVNWIYEDDPENFLDNQDNFVLYLRDKLRGILKRGF